MDNKENMAYQISTSSKKTPCKASKRNHKDQKIGKSTFKDIPY